MGENQWFQPTVKNHLPDHAIVLADFVIEVGKFFDTNNRYEETKSAQGTVIGWGGQHEWGHCGRENSPTGTTGYFEIRLDKVNGEQLARIYWNCPYSFLGGTNKVQAVYENSGYEVSIGGFGNPIFSGALGRGTISITKRS